MFMSDSGGNCLALHIAGPNLVWGVGYDLLGAQNPLDDQAPNEVTSHANELGSFRHRHSLAILFGGTISMDTMLAPRRTHALRIPCHTLNFLQLLMMRLCPGITKGVRLPLISRALEARLPALPSLAAL
jgi:hypothetical protein